MRPSKRTEILDAAVAVVEREGLGALTYEALATETGLTKGGLLYHFASRDALVEGVHSHLAARWEQSMIAAAGKPAEEADPRERLEAYARVAVESSTRAELTMLLDGSRQRSSREPWAGVVSRWLPEVPPDGGLDDAALRALVVRLAADGLWLHDAIDDTPLSPWARERVADYLARLADTSVRVTSPGEE